MVPSSRLRRSPAPENPLENEYLLDECLIRLPPLPSSLPRTSLVCKRWRRLVSDPDFQRRFRGHHRRPPLLGYFGFDYVSSKIEFTSALDPPDRIPVERFLPRIGHDYIRIFGCRHGRVLYADLRQHHHLLVWDPISVEQCRVAIPLDFRTGLLTRTATVICSARDNGHVHGGCHTSPFQVIMVGSSGEGVYACVYSSEEGSWGNLISGTWGNLISELGPNTIPARHCFGLGDHPGTLSGNCIFWLPSDLSMSYYKKDAILAFDLGRQSLAVMRTPPGVYEHRCQFLITHADGGGLGFVILSGFSATLWKWNDNKDGVAEWLVVKTIELSNLLSLTQGVNILLPDIIGFSEADNAMFLWTFDGVFMVYLESLQFKKLPDIIPQSIYPFTSFYPAGA